MRDTLRHISTTLQQATGLLAILLVCSSVPSSDANAQTYRSEWLNVGEMANMWTEEGGRRLAYTGNYWPYIQISRQGGTHGYANGLYVSFGSKDFVDHNGEEWSYFGVQLYPDDPPQKWSKGFKLVSKFPAPEVIVDGNESVRNRVQIDEVDPTIAADRMIVQEINTLMGLTIRREISQFSQEHHDNYNILDMTLTNTGETNQGVDWAEEIYDIPEQTLNGLYMSWARHWSMPAFAVSAANGASWGRWMMHDYERNDIFRATFAWGGRVPHFDEWDPIGYPAINAGGWHFPTSSDNTGRLLGTGFVGNAAIHTDASPSDKTDDVNQPVTMRDYNWGLFDDLSIRPWDESGNQKKYEEIMEYGIMDPYHAERVAPDGDYAHAEKDPEMGATAGFVEIQSYGPYDLDPGESINIVMVDAVNGLDHEASVQIGAEFKRLWEEGNQYGDIEYDANGNGTIEADEVMDKNEWVMTGRDSLFLTFRRAEANYASGYNIPEPPRPPSRFEVNSGVGQLDLRWEYPEGESDPVAFEIYRGHDQYQGSYEDVFRYRHIATVDGDVREYADDHNVERGVDYFYYIQAVGEVNNDDTGLTPTGVALKSNRYYTQTYTGVRVKRVPGETISDTRVVPNPFHVGASENVRYAGGAERIGFLDIPGQCTIRIFTERGDHVRTIEHTDGTGDDYWNLHTKAEQMVASGLYIAVIEDHATGESIHRKFVVIR